MLSYFLLGDSEVRSPVGRLRPRGGFQRTLLHVLLVSEGRVVSRESLISELWGEAPPDGVANALQAHVSRLRKKLDTLEPLRPASRLVSHPYGYQLSVEGCRVDATVFTGAVREAQNNIADHPQLAAAGLRAALALWRGPVFGGGEAGGPMCRAGSARYEECRIRAQELPFESELARGNHLLVLGELREAHAENPLHERFCQQLMLALYRSGRQVEALDVCRQTWSRPAEGLGIAPSPVLRRIEQAILEQRPDLEWVAGAGDSRASTPLGALSI